MTRLTYKKINDILVSKAVSSPEGNLVVNLKSNGTFLIVNTDGLVKHSSNEEMNLPKAKVVVKAALKSLGATFENEVRPRYKGLTYEEEVLADLKGDQ